METLNVENASRRSLQEIAHNFQSQLTECQTRLAKAEELMNQTVLKNAENLALITKQQVRLNELEHMDRKMKELFA